MCNIFATCLMIFGSIGPASQSEMVGTDSALSLYGPGKAPEGYLYVEPLSRNLRVRQGVALLVDSASPRRPQIVEAMLADSASPRRPQIVEAMLADSASPRRPQITAAVLADSASPRRPQLANALV